jgi:hypothetical protein
MTSLSQLIQYGFNVAEFKNANINATSLIQAGFGANDLSNTLIKFIQDDNG